MCSKGTEGVWRKQEKKCSFWDAAFKASRRGLGCNSELSNNRGRVLKTGEDRDSRQQPDTAQQRHRESDPSYSCPAGERIGGIGEAQQGPAVGSMLAVCVCVCMCPDWLPVWKRMPGVQRAMQAPMKFSTEQNRCICFLNWRNLLMCIYEGK